MERFSALALLRPGRDDHSAAGELRNTGRRSGVQLGTVDALIARLCIGNDLTLLTTDQDFSDAPKHCKLKVWSPQVRTKRGA